jgi:RNA polymerase sigma-70 factor (ECF subfamily)
MQEPPPAVAALAAETAARNSYGKLIAFLAARTRDVAGAEDALSEAFAAALAEWPRGGVPRSPEAWLLTVARRRMVDAVRLRLRGDAASEQLQLLGELREGDDDETSVPDRRLGLLFACAHPGIERDVRAPLMLQVVLGFDAATIASAFLVAPATMGQRLSRAKAKIRQAGIPFEVPGRAAWSQRLDAVLEAIYAAYAEGWSDPLGTDAHRRNLADEAIWLSRLVASLLPDDGEALGLLALMLHAHARRLARRSATGEYVPLAEQDPALWDAGLVDEAEALLWRANRCDGVGRYWLEAAVQSAHAVRRRTGSSDWAAIEQLYAALCSVTGSPVAALNHAVALARTRGATAGLAALDALAADPRLRDYQPYWAARAELLARCGEAGAAAEAYRRAIGLESDPAVRRFLQQREAALGCD